MRHFRDRHFPSISGTDGSTPEANQRSGLLVRRERENGGAGGMGDSLICAILYPNA